MSNAMLDPSYVVKLLNPSKMGDPKYGHQLSPFGSPALPGEGRLFVTYRVRTERYADGATVNLREPHYELRNLAYGPMDPKTEFSIRHTPSLITAAVIDLVGNNEGESDRLYGGGVRYGFTWKGHIDSLESQIGAALHFDMGLTSPDFPKDDCGALQLKCQRNSNRHDIDVPKWRLGAMATFIRSMIDVSHASQDTKGLALFKSVQCQACHAVSSQSKGAIKPVLYSDGKRHYMGSGLAGSLLEEYPGQWRTAPLFGNVARKRSCMTGER